MQSAIADYAATGLFDAAARRARATRHRTAGPGPARPVNQPARRMKLAVVVQRYGPAINGGAELHARYIAEHLAESADVRVLTTCAADYLTWRSSGVDARSLCTVVC